MFFRYSQGLWQYVSVALQEWDSKRWSYAKASATVPCEKCTHGVFHLPSQGWDGSFYPQHKNTLFVPLSKGAVHTVLTDCPNVSPPVPVQCLLALLAPSQSSHRFNSESSAILVCRTFKQRREQLLPQKDSATERRHFPSQGSTSSRLILGVQQQGVAKDPDSVYTIHMQREVLC
jgi:hypothetical protein